MQLNKTYKVMNFTAELQKDNGSFPLPFNNSDVIIVASTLITMCVFGTIANVIAITTVLSSKKLKSTFYFLIMSLSVSDLLSALVSILVLYRLTWGFDVWYWSDFACKLMWSADTWTSYVTSLHIVMFAIFRFISVYWPHKFTSFSLKRTKICAAVVWATTFVVGFIPFLFWFGAVVRDRSDPSFSSQWPSCSLYIKSVKPAKIYSRVVYPIMYYIPIILVSIFSTAIAIKISLIRKNRASVKGKSISSAAEEKQKRKENQILVQLALIVGSFLLGYLPRTAYHFSSLSTPPTVVNGRAVYNWRFAFIEYLLLRVSECLNPVFYNLSSSKMRKETKKTLIRVWKKVTQNFRDISQSQTTSESTTNKLSTGKTTL